MKLQPVGKSDRSQGYECIVFGQVMRDGRFEPTPPDVLDKAGRGEEGARALRAVGPWRLREMSPGRGLVPVAALMADSIDPNGYCDGSERLVVLSHGWSGQVRIAEERRDFHFDLHCDDTRLLLLDVADELVVDISPLASVEAGALRLPPLTLGRIVELIADGGVWFRFLDPEPQSDGNPFVRWREGRRRAVRTAARVRLLSALMARLVERASPAAPASRPAAPADSGSVRALQDQLRLVAAALDGASRRSAPPV